jgi:hypothetical protein
MPRNRVIIGLIGLIVLVAVTFPLWSPLFRSDVVDEAFPGFTEQQKDGVRAMPDDQQEMLVEMAKDNPEMAADTAAAMIEGDTTTNEDMPAQPITLLQGSFIRVDAVHAAEGTATIYEVDGQRVLRLENFRSTNGPDLHVFLSKIVPTQTFEGLGEDAIELGRGNLLCAVPRRVQFRRACSC